MKVLNQIGERHQQSASIRSRFQFQLPFRILKVINGNKVFLDVRDAAAQNPVIEIQTDIRGSR